MNERSVNMKEEELTYLTWKRFAHKASECQLESTVMGLVGDATVENVGKVEQVTLERSHHRNSVDEYHENYIKSEKI